MIVPLLFTGGFHLLIFCSFFYPGLANSDNIFKKGNTPGLNGLHQLQQKLFFLYTLFINNLNTSESSG